MSKQGHREMIMEGLTMPNKIRKRGCSSSSSSSSRIRNYRLNKRAILVGKNRAGLALGRSRSSTPAPAWRTTPLRSVIESPECLQNGKSTRPVTARSLAATLWEMNELPSPRMSEGGGFDEVVKKKKSVSSRIGVGKKEKMLASPWAHLHSSSGYLPPHLSDPSHSPTVSEKMERSGTGSRHRRTPSISQRLMSANQNVRATDSISNGSFMEVETRSRPPTSSGSVTGSKNRLKDVSNALTTSKELLKIISRMWANTVQPSSSTSLISALHTELERARLQVNHLIQDKRSDKTEINYVIKCFAEEKAAWKNKEHHITGELEAEKTLRRRLEGLNKKLGKELSETKSSLIKSVRDLEGEKRAREITEQVCEELARNVEEDRAEVEKIKRESAKIHEEVEKEREMLELADKLREERVHMKLSEAKHQFEEKSSAISKLRRQLEFFLRSKRDKDNNKSIGITFRDQIGEENNDGELEEEDVESDLHSIELNMDDNNSNKGNKWTYNPRKFLSMNNEIKTRNSISGPVSRKGVSLQRTVSDVVGSDKEGVIETPRRSYFDETQRYKTVKSGVKDHVLLSGSRMVSMADYIGTPSRERSSGKSRSGDVRGEGQSSTRRPKWGAF